MNKKLLNIGAVFLLAVATTVILLFTVGPLASKTTNDPQKDSLLAQKDSLLALKEGIIGTDTDSLARLANWDSKTDPCADGWTGITCSGSDVTVIDVCK